MSRLLFCVAVFLLSTAKATAQDTLPKFNVYKKAGGKVWVQWLNDYGVVKQITVQRSPDSLRGYASVFSSPNPMAKRGEYFDNKTKGNDFYYRIFVQLPEGRYFYTTPQLATEAPIGLVAGGVNRDSLGNKNLPKLQGGVQPYKPPVFVPSDYIFTDRKGNIIMNLPGAETKKFSVIFFDEPGNEVLKISHVKESNLILEKSNFSRSGWYFFEIYEMDKLVERHKVQVPKEHP